jgi:4-hydroxybutyrate CoA-transferase
MPGSRRAVAEGRAEFVPVRLFDVPRVFGRGGPLRVDAALVQVSPPDKEGRVSLGPSVSNPLPLAKQADLVIAQVNPRCPRTRGNSSLALAEIDVLVEHEEELAEYRPPAVGEVERKIAEQIVPLIPKGATLQIGIGNVPEALLQSLPRGLELSLAGMAVDAMVDLIKQGVVTGPWRAIELMGTRRLFDFVHDNPRLEMQDSLTGHNPLWLGRIPKFVSVNSAVEVDLTGQVNAESLGEEQISGLGGQFDFVEASYWSPGGFSIFAFPSTSGKNGEFSRIVKRLKPGAAVSTPRYFTRYVVTEYGVADLWGKSVKARAEALIRIAHPKFRAELAQ